VPTRCWAYANPANLAERPAEVAGEFTMAPGLRGDRVEAHAKHWAWRAFVGESIVLSNA
jgi:hypothetical protein